MEGRGGQTKGLIGIFDVLVQEFEIQSFLKFSICQHHNKQIFLIVYVDYIALRSNDAQGINK